MRLLPLLWLLAEATAAPPLGGPSAEEVEDPATASVRQVDELLGADALDADFRDILVEAKRRYFEGRQVEALDLLQGLRLRLSRGEEVSWTDATEALIYLGEIHLKRGEEESALDAFRWLLEKDPDTPINPYHHPVEVVLEFEDVRDQVRSRAVPAPEPLVPPAPVVIPSPPLRGYLPLGIPQLTSGRTGAGLLYGGAQVGFGAASVVTMLHIRQMNVPPEEHPAGWGEDEITQRIQQQRYLVQWPLTLGFYATWALSYADFRRQWKREHEGPSVGVVPSAAGRPGLTLRGSF